MSTSLQTRLNFTLRGTLTDDVGSYGVGPTGLQSSLTNGVAINQADVVYAHRYNVANGAPVSIDLAGALTMPGGASAVFVKVVELWIINQDDPTNTTHILSCGGGANAVSWLPSQVVGGPLAKFFKEDRSLAALPVTAATADIITLTSAAGTIPVDVLIIGRSA